MPERKSGAGFTVMEVMVALMILAISMFSTVGLLKWAVRGTDHSGRLTTATAIGHDKLEKLLNLDYGGLVSGADTAGRFARNWTVTESSGVKTILMEVRWNTVDGAVRSVTLQTSKAL